MEISIYTIGYTQKSASDFFSLLEKNNISKVLDIRLNNTSQLAGYTKKEDLRFFLSKICNIDYVHVPSLAPTKEILDNFKHKKGSWLEYRSSFLSLLEQRNIEKNFDPNFFDNSCLLCSEKDPNQCHRSLVAEYLNSKWDYSLNIKHLGC